MKQYRTALILGYGRSGRAAEKLLQTEQCETVVLSQEGSDEAAVHHILKSHSFDICIVSPGFRLSHPWMDAVRAAGIPLLSELELGWSRHQGRTVAVTGSNGKSTAVKWIAEMMQQAGRKTAIGGNYGVAACETVLENTELDWLVLEVSSFQLETVQDFRAEVALLLNVLPNHLDRHETIETYRRTKARIFGSASRSEDACLVPVELAEAIRTEIGVDRRWMTFGKTANSDFFYDHGQVFHEGRSVLNLSGTPFDSPVLGGCAGAAVAAVAAATETPYEVTESAARTFNPLPHRLQHLGTLDGVEYVNDSKATNLAAMAAALQACGMNIHLIAGGLSKESDYTFIKEILAERVRTIYLTGQASRAMYQAWSGVCSCMECGTLEKAFNLARHAAEPGEVILLSPGCASFDQFDCFEERGDRFMELFHKSAQSGGDAS